MEILEDYREQIDALDEQIIDLLAKRFDIVQAVGHLKTKENLSVVQPERAEEVKRRAADMAASKGLDPQFIWTLYEMMIDHAHVVESAIMDEAK